MAKKTYAQAHKEFQEGLEKNGWKVQRTNKSTGKPLSVPYATSPDGQHKLWFKAQSVHVSGGGQTVGEARTLSYADVRDLNFDDFHEVVKHRTGAGKKAGDVDSGPKPSTEGAFPKYGDKAKAGAAESMAKSRELSQAGKAEKIPDTTKPGDPDHEGPPKASSEPKGSFMDMIKAGGKVPEGQTQTDKGGTVSKAEAAAKMFGDGSKQHQQALAAERKAAEAGKPPPPKPPEPSKEGLAKFQQAKEAKATELNKYSLFEHMQGRDRAPNQISPTSLPHLRRAMQAGLVKVEGKELVLTDEGREAQEAHEAKRAPAALERAKDEVAAAKNILDKAKESGDAARVAQAEGLVAKREHDLKRAEERHARMGERAKLKDAPPPKGPAVDLPPPPGAGGAQATQEGPRGGRYYVNAAGEKVYVK